MVFEVALALSRTGKYQDNGPSLTLQQSVLKQLKVYSLRRDQIDINNGLQVPSLRLAGICHTRIEHAGKMGMPKSSHNVNFTEIEIECSLNTGLKVSTILLY